MCEGQGCYKRTILLGIKGCGPEECICPCHKMFENAVEGVCIISEQPIDARKDDRWKSTINCYKCGE